MYPFTVKFVFCLVLWNILKHLLDLRPAGAINMVLAGEFYGKLELFEMKAYLENSVQKSFIQNREIWISSLPHHCFDEYSCIVHRLEFLAPVVSLQMEALSYCIVSKTFAFGFQQTFDN